MPLTGEQRKAKIDAIKQGKKVGTVKIPYRDTINYEVDVYQIPWDAIIYNQFNDRIGLALKTKLTRIGAKGQTHEYDEKLHDLIDQELWESAIPENKITLISMQEGEQNEPGIITADGVVVDGNRRAMIGKRAGKKFYLAGILDDLYDGNEEILRDLETQLQFSVESKVDFNPLEKYFKVKTHVEKFGKSYSDLAKLMGRKYTAAFLQKWHEIANLMDDYLDYIQAPGCYDLLLKSGTKNSKENAFIVLHSKLKGIENGTLNYVDYDYSDLAEDYKVVMFNFIRTEAVANPQDYANYLSNKKGTGFFLSKDMKDDVINKVNAIMAEPLMNLPSLRDLKDDSENKTLDDNAIIKKREEIIREETKEKMTDLVNEMKGRNLRTQRKLKPLERIRTAHEELSHISEEDLGSLLESSDKELIEDQIKEMQKKVNLIKKSLGM